MTPSLVTSQPSGTPNRTVPHGACRVDERRVTPVDDPFADARQARGDAACRRGRRLRILPVDVLRVQVRDDGDLGSAIEVGDLVAGELDDDDVGVGASSRSSTGTPILPASASVRPAARARWATNVAVVLLPFVPVTPMAPEPPVSASHSAVAVVAATPAARSVAQLRPIDGDAGRPDHHIARR